MLEEKISQEFRFKNIDQTRNYLIEEINRNELISDKHKTVFTTLSYIEHSLILISTVTGWNYFCFFGRYSNRNYEFCGRIKSLCNNCSN